MWSIQRRLRPKRHKKRLPLLLRRLLPNRQDQKNSSSRQNCALVKNCLCSISLQNTIKSRKWKQKQQKKTKQRHPFRMPKRKNPFSRCHYKKTLLPQKLQSKRLRKQCRTKQNSRPWPKPQTVPKQKTAKYPQPFRITAKTRNKQIGRNLTQQHSTQRKRLLPWKLTW